MWRPGARAEKTWCGSDKAAVGSPAFTWKIKKQEGHLESP